MSQNKLGRFVSLGGVLPLVLLTTGCQGIALLDPKGPIGAQERDLMVWAVGLGLIVIIPVFAMVAWFSIRYRESNKKATYKPHWEGSLRVEAFIWLVPVAIIAVLSYLTWVKTADLDPYKPLPSVESPLRVQVVSLDWNWLFLYPEQGVASLNELVIPAGRPITFDLTSATVMTSFFIPDLGSQMYVMAGMVSHLNLLADHPGTFTGHNMEFSGKGYSSMHFSTRAVTPDQFGSWTNQTKEKASALDLAAFDLLNKPQAGLPPTAYAPIEPGIFDHIVAEFMHRPSSTPDPSDHEMKMGDSPTMTTH